MFDRLMGRVRLLLRKLNGDTGRMLPSPLKVAAQASRPPVPRAPTAPARTATPELSPERRIERTRALAVRLFGANQPVDNPRDLFGREHELATLRETVLESGMHAVIHGPRGSGKTSLVRVFGDMADARGATIIYLSCAGTGDFGQVILPYLHELGPAPFGLRGDEYAKAIDLLSAAPTPRAVAALLARADRDDVVFILDEFDRLDDSETKAQLALLLKLLSDMRSRVRLLFVGISGDVSELIDVHASVRRHLTAVGLKPIADAEVKNFIRLTSNAIGLTMAPSALEALRWAACGSPYHMRLFSLQACLVAIDRGQQEVDDAAMTEGLRRAQAVWRTTNPRDDELFARLLGEHRYPIALLESFARACATHLEFTVADLTEALIRDGHDPAQVPHLIESFAPALGRMQEGSQRLAFDDVLAPQLLLAMCVTTRTGSVPASSADEGTMQ
ncbi:hypothetical protein ASE73_16070 [Sphingomonas sp. Leaf24]|uniref:AAA family ATPase n=1 Tax=unclassified Sphingomonas TaxID=196159 RepID=UPI0006FAC22A|nr:MULTISPECIES: ATP-binding protein [unclassified Sphingomonas]KQM20947.1 hypothetical protein ASE50_15290 [Sphingomonas sp. Leaf5]KQM93348.1 hypothetical protein ASE73_16070 [Sphingomonas sp. Leaf24]